MNNSFWKALGLGVIAGMRTASAPVIACHLLSQNPSKRLAGSPLRFMQSKTAAKILALFALTEFVIDKLPTTPNRIEPAGIAFRSASGALAGASIYEAAGENAGAGAVLGAAAAVASAYGSFYLRKAVVKETGIYDPVVGGVEDALIAGAFISLLWCAARNKRV